MGKQKQQVISRFFAPKPKSPPPPPPPPPKISATVTFSPAKRRLTSNFTTSRKHPKLSPHTQNPVPPSLHQRFLQKLLEPSTPQQHPASSSKPPTYTPLEQQVLDLKAKHPDVLLMVEVGYKYRFFGQDAEHASRVLGIYAHMDHNFLTASIPTFRLNVHVRRLVTAGYKVGVVKQTETAAIKAHGSNRSAPFERGLSALYTKATLEAAPDLGGAEDGCGGESNYLLCVVEKSVLDEKGGVDARIGIVAVEISTGDVVFGEFCDGFLRSALEAVVLNLSPAELLLGDPLSKQTEKLLLDFAGPASNVRVERFSRDCFIDGGALAEVMTLYENMHIDSPSDSILSNDLTENRSQKLIIKEVMNMPDLAVQALALTIRHLKEFGFERILCSGASIRPFSSNTEMTLSANALQQLEVLKNNSDGSEIGSLLQIMNRTLTIFGSRLLRHWVSHPLCDQTLISARLHAVSEIAQSMGSCNSVKNLVRVEEDPDVAIVQPELAYTLSLVLTTLGRAPDIQRGITRIFHCTATPSEVIRAREAFKLAVEKLDSMIDFYRKRLGMKNLEFISISGTTHLIELSTDVKVPSNWVKVNSTKKTIRYHPPEVLTALDKLSLAKEELTVACRAAWNSFLTEFSKHYAEFQAAVQALAALDCLHSLAILSRNKGYVCPVFVDDHEPVQIQISSGRHPVLETTLQDNFVPNDTNMHADGEYCQIVTGPNMGGKSCYIRQVALIVIMAQVGSFVPASSAKLHVLDRIYTRMGASDSIQQGRSTFLEELSETSHILNSCTEHSLVIIDELGRGTSTHDGMAIAHATLHYLLKQKRSMVLFVTHYPKIASLATEFPGSVAAYHVSHLISHDASKNSNLDHDVTYLYKLVPGVSERSFGFKVAQLAQLPSHCISRAIVMASKLEALVNSRIHGRSTKELLLDTLVIGQEKEQLMAQSLDRPHKEFDMAYKDFYLNLKAATQDDDWAKSFHLLEHARSIAKKLIGRSMQYV
ncbi:DNA mismatch repair protein MSH3 isoform X2 [Glycine soja]|uniref:DNA mismatch repair protein MSH3 n=1 Tax=Glycine soja TaxID=3848 RepID=A0A445F5L3_GLYSO|nr:DNA mismatch repair protein MSH3 isoform X2 [Glycine soja]RZB44133.1 DNA mismatch repair protein MSH3 isoform F [Glycine soja]